MKFLKSDATEDADRRAKKTRGLTLVFDGRRIETDLDSPAGPHTFYKDTAGKVGLAVVSHWGNGDLSLIDGETGIIARTTEEFADAVSELIDDPEKAATYARRGRQLVSERFLITRYLGDYLRILTELHRGH